MKRIKYWLAIGAILAVGGLFFYGVHHLIVARIIGG